MRAQLQAELCVTAQYSSPRPCWVVPALRPVPAPAGTASSHWKWSPEAWSSPSHCPAVPSERGSKAWDHPWGCRGTGVNAGQNPCDSFSLNYNNLYQGQFLLCVFFLSTQQGVTELSHLPTLSSHFLRDNIPKSRQNRHLQLDNILELPQNNPWPWGCQEPEPPLHFVPMNPQSKC